MHGQPNDVKLRHTFVTFLIFLLVSLPCVYRLTNAVIGGTATIGASGSVCPTTMGIFLHGLVFAAIIYGLMFVLH